MAINLYNIDCMDFMRELPDKAYDLAIVDPPYGINAPNMQMGNNAPSRGGKSSVAVKLKKGRLNAGGKMHGKGILLQDQMDWDLDRPTIDYFNELRRISTNQIIWGGNYFTDMLPASRCWICWDKLQPWENFSQFELAWTSFDKPTRIINYSNTGGINGEAKIHPTQKPVFVYSYLLQNYANPGDNIIDTHGGSGSVLIACYNLGFSIDWTELDQDYFKDAEKRFNSHVSKYSPADIIPINKDGQVKLF